MTTVTAALITGAEQVELLEFDDKPPAPGAVTVDIAYCGICGTEVSSYRTGSLHAPSICGHEWTGVISAVGDGVDPSREGQRVIGGVPTACGQCPECRQGLGMHCRTVSLAARGKDPLAPAHGGFARRITVAAGRTIPALDSLSEEQLAQVEPATISFHGIRRSGIRPGDVVVVQGAGPIGLYAAQAARIAGAGHVVVIEPTEQRRQVALATGATEAIAPDGAADRLQELTGGLGADVVIECSGVPSLLQSCIELARMGGRVTLLSYSARPSEIMGAKVLAKELTITGANAYEHGDFGRVMDLMADGRIQTAPLHTSTVGLAGFADAVASLAGGESSDIKILVDPRL